MFTQWVIVLLRLMAVELTGSSGDASVRASQQHPAGTDQMVCFGLEGEGELSCDLCLLQYVETLGKIIGSTLRPAPLRR